MTSDYVDGWADCRTYAGQESGRSEDYDRGFSACVRAYGDALAAGKGWDAVPASLERIRSMSGVRRTDEPVADTAGGTP
jgi:hypothetical protein